MRDNECVHFLQWALPRLQMRWSGFRKVRRQICKRLQRRVRDLQLKDLTDYREYIERDASEWKTLDELCRISISRFYRDRGVMDVLRKRVLPIVAQNASGRDNAARAWSAGCASGEEAYTLRMIWDLEVQRRWGDVGLSIVATDTDPHLLERAARGQYPASSIKDLPPEWTTVGLRRHEEAFRVRDRFRHGIDFLRQDLRRAQPQGLFDLVLCRYLAFTYFDEPLQSAVLARIQDRMRTNGMLVIGRHETLPAIAAESMTEVHPNTGIYRR